MNTEEKTHPEDALLETKKPSGIKKFTKYLRELSVVVIGVAITFIGSNWINSRQERLKLERHLEAVKTELQDNLAEIKKKEEYYRKLARLTHYLASDLPENLNQEVIDSLNLYGDYSTVIGSFFNVICKTSAFEMLKSSGTMNLIRDPDLSRAILDSYTSLETTKLESDNYMATKMQEIRNTIMDQEQVFYGDILHPKFRRLFYYFAAYLDFENLFRLSARQIEETLALL